MVLVVVWKYSYNGNNNSFETFAFAAGDIGIEYNFDIPLLISMISDLNLVEMDITKTIWF
jgi:hypothetical protein